MDTNYIIDENGNRHLIKMNGCQNICSKKAFHCFLNTSGTFAFGNSDFRVGRGLADEIRLSLSQNFELTIRAANRDNMIIGRFRSESEKQCPPGKGVAE